MEEKKSPDPHAVAIARAMQEHTDGLIILFGSRAKGTYAPSSDMDVLLVGHTIGRPHEAARRYMETNPPQLHLEVMEVTPEKFSRERLANQSIISKACRHGVWMSTERTDYNNRYEEDYPAHWTNTRTNLANSWENMYRFEELVEEKSWDHKMVGFYAQQTVENGLKSLLSLHQDTVEFRHDLQGIWNHYLRRHHDPNRSDHEEIRESVEELMKHTRYQDSNGRDECWLTLYAAVYRYGQEVRRMPEWERQQLRDRVQDVFLTVMEHVCTESGTMPDDVFPEGKPWEDMP